MVSFHDSVQEIYTHQNDHSSLPLVSRPSQVGKTLVTCLPQVGGPCWPGGGGWSACSLCPDLVPLDGATPSPGMCRPPGLWDFLVSPLFPVMSPPDPKGRGQSRAEGKCDSQRWAEGRAQEQAFSVHRSTSQDALSLEGLGGSAWLRDTWGG